AIVVAGGCYFLGGFGRLYGDKIAYNEATGKPLFDTIVPTMLSTLPSMVIAIVIVLVLAASMSTLSSLVLTSSSTFTLDVIKTVKKDMSEKKQVTYMRVFILFFIVISAVIAVVKDSYPGLTFIAQMMGVSWGALAGAFLAPFLYGLYWKKVTPASVGACYIWGCAIALIQLFITLSGTDVSGWGPVFGYIFKSSINSGVIAMVGGLIVVPLISLFTAKMDEKTVDEMFTSFERKVQVPQKEALD
ncbi:MAG: sodium:solute symporter, partial [Lachnospiraceae bacterium]|nr:sodium:solute symporter [Lachnospiraceae bacterium]